ncbi:MAG TPA: FAD-dependent thymidylate synthase [Acidobacteriaceae bacterium]|nr:FAD-dependent thymidylate synthase [Acidobacteriaceae bacterium]
MTQTESVTLSTPAEAPRNQTEVYAVHGADPEVLAYAMAKYSRSALSMKDSLREISSQRAEHFLNTFYFQYGHRSIADLAHVAFAIERLSLLAAIILVDEQRWDGQERSTRYQNFQKSGWYLPDFSNNPASRSVFTEAIDALFAEYHACSEAMFGYLKGRTPRPAEMKEEAFNRALRARAFDVSRYLLPLATNTSLGQIVNARTLETQISRLLSDTHEEVRNLGERLREAAAGSAWNVQGEALSKLQREITSLDPALGADADALLTRDIRIAPTLVKYAAPNDYVLATRSELAQAATELMKGATVERPAGVVDLLDDESLEIDLATTLLYGASHYSYRQIARQVGSLEEARRNEIIALGARHRGRHDELLREFSSGQSLRFDILMDIGGFRDMHRHRRCIQILQPFTNVHGYEIPDGLIEAGLRRQYDAAMTQAHEAFVHVSRAGLVENARYALPLGTRTRALFKMDFAEALYIAELRSAPAGHFSYRRVAWEMYQAVARRHPALAQYFRVADIQQPVDLLQR